PPTPASRRAARPSPDARAVRPACAAARAPAQIARDDPVRPLLLPPRSDVRHARGRTSPRTAPRRSRAQGLDGVEGVAGVALESAPAGQMRLRPVALG